MSGCLTCAKTIGIDGQSLTISENKDVQNALCKHFWFGENQYLESTICCPCWRKIDDFHRFYSAVEELYSQQLYPHIQLTEIKQENDLGDFNQELEEYTEEPLGCDIQEGEPNVVKTEVADKEFSGGDEDYEQEFDDSDESSSLEHDDDSNGEQDDEDDSDYKMNKPRRQIRRTRASVDDLAQIKDYVAKNLTLECDTCSERFTEFKHLQDHSKVKHSKRATVFCCKRKLQTRYRFEDHIRLHLNPDRFKCSECQKKLPNQEALNRHKNDWHAPEGAKHTCKVCFKQFFTKKGLLRHESIHQEPALNKDGTTRKRRLDTRDGDNEKMIAENVNLECDSCQMKYDTFLNLQKHSMADHGKLSYVFCCDQKFNKKPRLIDHVLFHLDPTRFQCKICHKNLPHTESLKRHMDKKHAPEETKTLKCSMCPKMFTHQKFLNTHERYHNRRWHCEICDKRFICEATLKQHHKSVHTKELNYVCHVCAKTFHIYSSYRSHLETHDGSVKKKPPKPPVQCPVCNAWTPKLSHHMRLHSGTQTCEICGRECKNEIAYRYHMKNHETGDFMCSICSKGFKKEITLKEHMASHTGVTLYSCDFCDRTFNSNANRASHRKKMHPQQWLEDKLKKKAAKQAQLEGGVEAQDQVAS